LSGKSAVTEIAQGPAGDVLTSPTSDSDASAIYWADEWMTDAGVLSSNIMMRQESDLPGSIYFSHRRWVRSTTPTIVQGAFREDGTSFRPQIADGTLFWLNTSDSSLKGTPTATQTPLVTTPQTTPLLIPRTEPGIYAPALDSKVTGQIMAQPLDGLTPAVSVNSGGVAYALQVGSDFALWQNGKGYEMYDVPTQNDVTIGNTLNDAALLAVNGDSTVWLANPGSATTPTSAQSQATLSPLHFFAFDWPK
jgi:hypothetical protein